MSTVQPKEDNLIQLSANDKTNDIKVNNKINRLEKSLNDMKGDLSKSSSELKSELENLNTYDATLTGTVNKALHKITLVEEEISQLYTDIDKTNLSINNNVERIESEQNDLSAKVSETYKQLGSVEKQYTALKTKSSKISKDIQEITEQVQAISDENREKILLLQTNTNSLDNKINSVESQSNEKSSQLSQGQDELIERTNTIVKEAQKTTIALEKSIKENSVLMANVESKLVSEIELLAKDTDEKIAKLGSDIEQADAEIKSHTAKMLLLQSVDEALEKRSLKLEETTKTLSSETKRLFSATTTLDKRSTALEDSFETLEIQVYRIEQENEVQQAQIDLLREKTTLTDKSLAALTRLISFKFVATSGFLVLLIAAVTGLYLMQDNLWSTDATTTVQRNNQVDQKISGLTQHVNTTDNQATDRIAQLETQVLTLNQQLKTVNDKNVSLDNRLVNIAPHRTIGNDNVLHSLQWITQQTGSNYAIKVLTATSEQQVFELAVRYNHNLTGVLSFKSELNDNELSYILYMGNYADKKSAELALKALPFRLNGETPELTTYSAIQ